MSIPTEPRPKRKPPEVVKTYAELEGYLKGFRDGHMNLLVLLGRPGTGKTEAASAILDGKARWLSGMTSTLGLYAFACRNAGEPIVLDDVDNLFRDQRSVTLLKALCQHKPVKRVMWESRPTMLRAEGLPSSFETTSRVLIIANQIRRRDDDVSAVTDRGICLEFEPDAREVHARVGQWFEDRQIYDWFGERLDQVEGLSQRDYLNALSRKRSCIDWRKLPASPARPGKGALAREILADPRFADATTAEMAREFKARGGGCARTFYNWKKRIEAENG